jgi:hypothetical protein
MGVYCIIILSRLWTHSPQHKHGQDASLGMHKSSRRLAVTHPRRSSIISFSGGTTLLASLASSVADPNQMKTRNPSICVTHLSTSLDGML